MMEELCLPGLQGGLGYLAACHEMGACLDACIPNGDLCTIEQKATAGTIALPSGACNNQEDCLGEGQVCVAAGLDLAEGCIRDPNPDCNPFTGYYDDVLCLNKCMAAVDAVCLQFQADQIDAGRELLKDYRLAIRSGPLLFFSFILLTLPPLWVSFAAAVDRSRSKTDA
eukprot:scaffold35609_cov42-Prasinocladus_malaysianus.AAC.2